MLARALEPATRGLAPADGERLLDVVLVLWSSAALQAFKDYLGLDASGAADRVAWAISALTAPRAPGKARLR